MTGDAIVRYGRWYGQPCLWRIAGYVNAIWVLYADGRREQWAELVICADLADRQN